MGSMNGGVVVVRGMRPVLLAAVLWASVFAPLCRASFTAEAAPEAQTPLVAVAPACVATMAAAAICVGGSAFLVWWFGYGGQETTVSNVQAAWDWFEDWWNDSDGEPAHEQIEQSFTNTAYYIYPTVEMLQAWSGGFASLGSPWQMMPQPGFVGFAMPTTYAGGATIEMPWQSFMQPLYAPGSCTGVRVDLLTDNATVSAADQFRVEYGAYVNGAIPGSNQPAATTITQNNQYISVPLHTSGTGMTTCELLEAGLWAFKATVTNLNAINTPDVQIGHVRVRVTVNGTSFAYTYTDVAYWDPAPASTVIPNVNGERVNIPATADDLVGWNGTSALPLAQGNTGTVIIPQATTGTGDLTGEDDRPWWEGLFEGVRSGVSDVWGKLQEILEAAQALGATLAEVLTSIGELPAMLIGAFTAALAPDVGPGERSLALADTAKTKAPFAWPVEVFAGVGALFSGAGSACPEILIPLPAPWEDYNMIMCPPPGTAAIIQTLSRLVALGVLAVWAYWLYRRFVGGEGG